MAESEGFYLLFELAKKWDLDVKKLVHLAGQGLIEVRVLAPEQYDEQMDDNEYVRRTIDGTYEYRVVSTLFLQELIGKGESVIKSGTVIQKTPQLLIYTFRDTEFSDLAVFESEARRFEREFLNKPNYNIGHVSDQKFNIDEPARVVTFNGRKSSLTKNQILCLIVLKKRFESFSSGQAATIDMPQGEILREAGLPENNRRLDQVFRSRKDEFKLLIASPGAGRYGLNLKVDRPLLNEQNEIH